MRISLGPHPALRTSITIGSERGRLMLLFSGMLLKTTGQAGLGQPKQSQSPFLRAHPGRHLTN